MYCPFGLQETCGTLAAWSKSFSDFWNVYVASGSPCSPPASRILQSFTKLSQLDVHSQSPPGLHFKCLIPPRCALRYFIGANSRRDFPSCSQRAGVESVIRVSLMLSLRRGLIEIGTNRHLTSDGTCEPQYRPFLQPIEAFAKEKVVYADRQTVPLSARPNYP